MQILEEVPRAISLWRGTAAVVPSTRFVQIVWRAPSRKTSQPRFRKCLSNSLSLIPANCIPRRVG